jgi:excisionase family DNA binding protein
METPQLPPRLLNPRQLARTLGVSTGHIYRLCQQRKVPFCRVGGSVRFRSDSIERWIRGQEVATVAEVLGRRGR